MNKLTLSNPYFIFLGILLFGCKSEPPRVNFQDLYTDHSNLSGKKEYLNSPYVTAGDRVYMVGHQDGTFPDLGWHVEGEMGGIWNHPIKLMDGFTNSIQIEGSSYCLDRADQFINYPFGNKHIFSSSIPELEVQRFQFVPEGIEGMVIEFSFTNKGDEKKSFDFNFTGHTDLMPVWLGDRAGMIDDVDNLTFDESRKAWRGKDASNDWYVLFGSNQAGTEDEGIDISCLYEPQGNGVSANLKYTITVKPGKVNTLRFFIAGSYKDQDSVEKTYDLLSKHADTYLKEKIEHYEKIASKSRVTIPDKELELAFEWIKYNTEWLVRDVPEIGRGLGAGMPDYPWWFGVDNEYTLKGAIATGRKDLVYSTIELIHKLSETNGNGKIIHEVSSNGVIFNPGNINETPQFASLIYWVYQWTGDKEFLKKYYPFIKKGLKWLMEENDQDGNLFPDGYGMMEIHGLESEMIDVAVYTQKAFADAAKMAKIMGETEQAESYQHTADLLKEKINKEFWVEEYNAYADFIGTTSEALHLIDAAIVRADTLQKPWAVEELKATKQRLSTYPRNKKQGFVLFHNWVVNTPMEMGIAEEEKAIKALNKGSKFVNPFGVFVTGIDRDEASESADGKFEGSKVFSYTGAVMTLPTGVQAIAENNYGRPDEALGYLQRMTKSFGFALPGSIYEVSPDYGMMAQAWNLYSYAVPLVTQFFGINPDAQNKVVHIKPQMPSSWNSAKIENVIMAENSISMDFKKEGNEILIEVKQENGDWEIHLDPSFYPAKSIKLNDTAFDSVEKGTYSSTGKSIIYTLTL
ncbi:glycogen debranching protein [Belliella sp. DSM 107340]|uniref:Glycogen debranching protein n=1 Tax=Belliella calami TaxID=2923436 RepID=A0ABS9UMM1_9BACT|nr:glycogen debranching protein [Belliella calami]MCH7397851.1 glycogen debranching protein [Belliella calami]